MALSLNQFQTIPYVAPTGGAVGIYTAPIGYTGVVLLAQAANVGAVTRTVSLSFKRDSTTTEIVKDLPIEASDTANLLTGKLVLETNDVLMLEASNGSDVKFLGSILETLN